MEKKSEKHEKNGKNEKKNGKKSGATQNVFSMSDANTSTHQPLCINLQSKKNGNLLSCVPF